MNSHPLNVRLTENHVALGPVLLVPRGKSVSELTHLLGSPDRVIVLKYENTLYIYDQFGFRFWARAGVVGEVQLVLETEDNEVFPKQAFTGPITCMGHLLFPPMAASLLKSGELPGFVQDTDSLQYNMVVYEAKTSQLKHTAIVSRVTGDIKTLSVS